VLAGKRGRHLESCGLCPIRQDCASPFSGDNGKAGDGHHRIINFKAPCWDGSMVKPLRLYQTES